MHIDERSGAREVARHELTTPGRVRILDEHYPPRPAGALARNPRARSAEEREFLAIGEGAERWLTRAAAAGVARIRRKMAEAVDLAKLHGQARGRALAGGRACCQEASTRIRRAYLEPVLVIESNRARLNRRIAGGRAPVQATSRAALRVGSD